MCMPVIYIITDEFSVQETLLIPQSVEWLENARIYCQNNFIRQQHCNF
jgi:hypothetical protein